MVHLRLNERSSNPNPFINFTTALPSSSSSSSSAEADEAAALELLRALAAQVKPIMQKHGFTINSLEEYASNRVFLGRNWNAGEVIELVLRRPSGTFYPISYLLNTLCHELAHITHMNHSGPFQALWRLLTGEVEALRRKGYRGDGMFSAGQRVGDGLRVSGDAGVGEEEEDVPEYMCGGAEQRARPARTGRKRRVARNRRQQQTGRQTERRRKPGGRVRKEVFGVGGERVDGREEGEREGSMRGKRAGARGAREARAEAAERRLRALRAGSGGREDEDGEEEEEEEEGEEEPESDDESRMRGMLRQMKLEEMDGLRTSTSRAGSARASGSGSSGTGNGRPGGVIDLTQTDEEDEEELPDVSDMLQLMGEDFVSLPTSEQAHAQPANLSSNGAEGKGKGRAGGSSQTDVNGKRKPEPPTQPKQAKPTKRPRPLSPLPPSPPERDTGPNGPKRAKQVKQAALGSLFGEEHRGAEGRRLGGPTPSVPGRTVGQEGPGRIREEKQDNWACGACTFLNDWALGRCEMCNVGERPIVL